MCKESSGPPTRIEAVRQTLEREKYDEVIVSTLPARVSRWLRLDLAHRIERFGVPVTVVTAEQAERTLSPEPGPADRTPAVSEPPRRRSLESSGDQIKPAWHSRHGCLAVHSCPNPELLAGMALRCGLCLGIRRDHGLPRGARSCAPRAPHENWAWRRDQANTETRHVLCDGGFIALLVIPALDHRWGGLPCRHT
jgi:hypothetical protein